MLQPNTTHHARARAPESAVAPVPHPYPAVSKRTRRKRNKVQVFGVLAHGGRSNQPLSSPQLPGATIARFERRAKNGKDADLKAIAEKTLPTFGEHLTMVRDLKTKLAKGSTN